MAHSSKFSQYFPEFENMNSRSDQTIIMELITYQFKIMDLKTILRPLSLPLTGRKQELIDRIVAFIDEHGITSVANIPEIRIKLAAYKQRIAEAEVANRRREEILQEQSRKRKRQEDLIRQQRSAHTFNPYRDYINEISDYDSAMSSSPNHRRHPHEFFEAAVRAEPLPRSNSMTIINSEFPTIKWCGIEASALDFNWMILPFHTKLHVIHAAVVDGGAKLITTAFNLSEKEFIDLQSGSKSLLFVMTHLYAAFLSTQQTQKHNKPFCLLDYSHTFQCTINNQIINYKHKGIKDTPGSAPPINLSKYCKSGPNTLQWSFTGYSKIATSLLYCIPVSISSLSTTIQQQPHLPKISKSVLISKLINTHNDDSIQFNDFTISLNDPMSLTRIQIPIISNKCAHIQPMDLIIFLTSQSHTPLFKCPICSTQLSKITIAATDFLVPKSLCSELANFPISKYFAINPISSIQVDAFTVQVLECFSTSLANEISIAADGKWTLINNDSDISSLLSSAAEEPDDTQIPSSNVNEHQDDEIILVNCVDSQTIPREQPQPESSGRWQQDEEDGVIYLF